MFNCYRTRKRIKHFLLGEQLSESETQRMYAHLGTCSRCSQLFEEEQEFERFIHQRFKPYQPQRNIVAEVLTQLDSEPNILLPEGKKIRIGKWEKGRPGKKSFSPFPRFPDFAIRSFTLRRHVWVSALVILGIFISLLIPILLYTHASKPMIVKNICGTGIYYLPQGSTRWQLVKPGMRLHAGEQLVTNKLSQVELGSDSGIEIWVNGDSRFQVAPNTSRLFFIQKGEIYVLEESNLQQEQTERASFRIKTPTAMVEPFGTSFDIRVAENGVTEVAVIAGQVHLANLSGTVTIPANYYSLAELEQNKPPSIPVITNTQALIQWVNVCKELTQYPDDSNKKLAEQTMELGLMHFKEKQMYAALTSFKYFTELMPNSPLGYYYLGCAYYSLEDYVKATAVFSKVLELTPNYSDTHFQLSICYFDLAQRDTANKDIELNSAKQEMELMVQQEPKNHQYPIWLGVTDIKLNKFEEGEQWIRKGLSLSPCEVCMKYGYYGLGLSAFKQGKFEDAIRYGREASTISAGCWLLSDVYYAMGNEERGKEYRKRGENFNQASRHSLAWTHPQQKKVK